MNKCLSCKGRLDLASDAPYSGDFCSEYCFSTYSGLSRRMGPIAGHRYHRERPRSDAFQILRRNRDILAAFRSWKQETPTMADIGAMQWLREKGFDFDYHTQVAHRSDGGTEVWCYDVGYRLEKDGNVEPL